MTKQQNEDNVISMAERIREPAVRERQTWLNENLKLRFDLEHAKIALSTSLLSVVILVTVANRNLMHTSSDVQTATATPGSRSIASVSTGTSDGEDTLVRTLARHELNASAIGRQPSSIEALAFGQLEGKYAIRLANGKLAELEFSDATSDANSIGDRPKQIEDRAAFLDSHRDILPVVYDKTVKIDSKKSGESVIESYELVNAVSRPLANVEFRLDAAGRLLSMRIAQLNLAAK